MRALSTDQALRWERSECPKVALLRLKPAGSLLGLSRHAGHAVEPQEDPTDTFQAVPLPSSSWD
jgi:hypothetical protein